MLEKKTREMMPQPGKPSSGAKLSHDIIPTKSVMFLEHIFLPAGNPLCQSLQPGTNHSQCIPNSSRDTSRCHHHPRFRMVEGWGAKFGICVNWVQVPCMSRAKNLATQLNAQRKLRGAATLAESLESKYLCRVWLYDYDSSLDMAYAWLCMPTTLYIYKRVHNIIMSNSNVICVYGIIWWYVYCMCMRVCLF